MTSFLEKLKQTGFENHNLQQSVARSLVWSRDASHYRIQPEYTLRANDQDELARLLSSAHETNTPVTFRSGGSSLSGQTLGRGVVVDTRTGFGKVLEIDDDSVLVQPGVTLARLNGQLSKTRRKIGPDPASMIASTIGGAVSNNSSGMTCGVEFNSYATIKSAKIIFADGEFFNTADADAEQKLAELKPELFTELVSIRDEIMSQPDQVENLRKLFSLKNTMGLSMNAFIDFDSVVDILLHLMVGAEGTLGFLAQVELGTIEIKEHKLTSLLIFESLSAANDSLVNIINQKPAAIELMDATSLHALNQEGMLPEEVQAKLGDNTAAILVEFEDDEISGAERQAESFKALFSENMVFSGERGETRNKLWSLRKGLYAVVAKARPSGTTAMLEDVVVPPEKLTVACDQLADLCDRFGYGRPVIFGHVRDGNIHFMISDDFSDPKRVKVFEQFTESMVEIILSLGGNLKAEHGTGRAMAPFVVSQFGEDLFELMLRVKKAFDPKGILNPGVIFAASETEYVENLKEVAKVNEIVDACVECGYCESSCPSAGLTLTPRERIVAFRELESTTGSDRKALLKELHYQADQTCAVDGMCAVNCPVGINTGTFVKEIRAEKTGGFTQSIAGVIESNWGTTTNIARTGLKLASKLPTLSKSVTKLAASIFPDGTIPQWDRHVQSNGFSRKKLINPEGEYFFLPSCMNEVFGEPQVIKLMELAKQKGIGIEVPNGIENFCCGTPFSSKGFQKATANRVSKNQEILSGQENRTVIIDGSSCHQTMLSQSSSVIELTEFIAQRMLDKFEVSKYPKIIVHPTCSGESGANKAMLEIAEAIADEVITPIDWKCCGFAGDRGLLVPELTSNATKLEVAEIENLDGVFVSNNQPCQIGLNGATDKNYISIIEAWIGAIK
jgi:D-lactate dehydrogenase